MPRIERVNDEFCKILNEIVAYEIKDPRCNTLIEITEVNVSPDLKHATVYCSVMDKEKEAGALEALNNAAGFIKSLVYKKVKIRTVPSFFFKIDTSREYGAKIDRILHEIHKKEEETKGKDEI